jgi:hypothetical protein
MIQRLPHSDFAMQHRASPISTIFSTTSARVAMRAFVIILAAATTATSDPALAQATPNVVNPTPGLQTPITSTTTNCMMSCNSQAANCRTTCVLPAPPTPPPSPSSSQAPNLNATPSMACLVGCNSTQLACQSGCALTSLLAKQLPAKKKVPAKRSGLS